MIERLNDWYHARRRSSPEARSGAIACLQVGSCSPGTRRSYAHQEGGREEWQLLEIHSIIEQSS